MPLSRERKADYFVKFQAALDNYSRMFIVNVDNVGSNQMQQIRISMRGKAELLMGKNTMMRKVLNAYLKTHPGHPYEQLLPHLVGNVGIVFTNGEISDCRNLIEANRVPAPCRAGAIAPCDVVVPPGPTGCDPGQTSFFQVLQISTKVTKGQIEIISPVNLIKAGNKVGQSEAALLQKLNILPFTYGMITQVVYDNGSLFEPAVLDLTSDILLARFTAGLRNVAAVSLAAGVPTLASLPHMVANAFKKVLAVAVECENFTFDKATVYKQYLADPSKFASAAPAAASGGAAAPAAAAAAVKEEESEEDMGGGMDMFGGSDY